MSDLATIPGERPDARESRASDWHGTALRLAGDGAYQLDLQGRFVAVNDVVLDVSGYDEAELLGEHATAVFEAWGVDRADELQAGLDPGGVARLGEELTPTDGDPFPVESRFAEFDGDGREEVERVVCERLAAADQFEFAWFGEVDADDGNIDIRTVAGVDGNLDGMTVPVDAGEECPVDRAIRTGTVQTVEDALADPCCERWHGYAQEYGYRSSVAVPVTYEGVLYGVLNVFATEPGVFEGDVEGIVSGLGQVVGHAINALDTKRALVGDRRRAVVGVLVEASGPLSLDDLAERVVSASGAPLSAERVRVALDHVHLPKLDDAAWPPTTASAGR